MSCVPYVILYTPCLHTYPSLLPLLTHTLTSLIPSPHTYAPPYLHTWALGSSRWPYKTFSDSVNGRPSLNEKENYNNDYNVFLINILSPNIQLK